MRWAYIFAVFRLQPIFLAVMRLSFAKCPPKQKLKILLCFCRQLYNLEHQVSGDMRLILSLLQQQHQMPPQLRRETSSSASSLGPDLREVHRPHENSTLNGILRRFYCRLPQTTQLPDPWGTTEHLWCTVTKMPLSKMHSQLTNKGLTGEKLTLKFVSYFNVQYF